MKSDFTYERMAQGEVELTQDANALQKIAELAASDRAFLDRHPVESLKNRTKTNPWTSATVLVATLALFVGLGTFVPRPVDTDTRAKSAALSLFVYHKTATGTELLGPQAQLGTGEEVQLAYFASGKRFAAILSVDGRGTVTTHLPLHGDQAVEIDTTKPELLPYSYKLDDAPDFETMVLVTSDQSFALSKIRPFLKGASAEKAGGLALPAEYEFLAVRIAKKETSQ